MKKELGHTRNRKPDISTLVYGKIPPQATDVEAAVLGAIMLERDKLDEVISIIQSPDVFYSPANRLIFEAITSLYKSGDVVDLMTVTQRLIKNESLELAGGPWYITELTANVVNSAHVEAHSRLLVEKHMLREAIRIAGEVIGQAYDNSTDPFELIDGAETSLMKLLQVTAKKEPQHIAAISRKNIMEAGEKRESKLVYNGPRIGLEKLEETLVCWQPTDLVIVGARPSTGKTAFSLQLAINSALSGSAAMFFSLEMGAEALVQRVESNVSDVMLKDIRRPALISNELWEKYTASEKKLSGLPVFIDDTAGLNISEFRAKAKKFHKKYGVKLFIIDYLQLMQGDGTAYNREGEISSISRALKKVAKELNVTVVALSQLNRVSARTGDNVPKMSDLRESGAIEQDADIIILMHRPEEKEIAQIRKDTGHDLTNKVRIDIAKHRNGETKLNIQLHFHREVQRFTDYGPNEQAEILPPDGFRPMTTEEKAGTSYQGIDFKSKAGGEKPEEEETPF